MEEEAEDAMNESLDKQQEQQEGQEAVTDEELQDVLGGDEEEPDEEDDELFPDMIAREVCLPNKIPKNSYEKSTNQSQ